MLKKGHSRKNGEKISKKRSRSKRRSLSRTHGRDYDSPYYAHGRFLNYEEDDKTLATRSFQKFIKWKWFTPLEKPDIPPGDWLKIEEPPMIQRIETQDFSPLPSIKTDSMRAVWLGHSSVWLCFSLPDSIAPPVTPDASTAGTDKSQNVEGRGNRVQTEAIANKKIHIVLDPVLGNLSYLLKRLTPLPIKKGNLPPVDAIVISHAHRDHLDMKSLKFLIGQNPQLTLYAPEGSENLFRQDLFRSRLQILRWYQSIALGNGIRIQFLPAQHWSQMKLNDFLQIHWGSIAFTVGEKSWYFAGDTAYAGHFEHIAQLYPQGFEGAFIPIGSFKPRSFMRTSHIAPEETLQATLELEARVLLPIHWGTFHLGDDLPQEAIYHLRHYAERLFGGDMQQRIIFWHPGQSVDFPIRTR